MVINYRWICDFLILSESPSLIFINWMFINGHIKKNNTASFQTIHCFCVWDIMFTVLTTSARTTGRTDGEAFRILALHICCWKTVSVPHVMSWNILSETNVLKYTINIYNMKQPGFKAYMQIQRDLNILYTLIIKTFRVR